MEKPLGTNTADDVRMFLRAATQPSSCSAVQENQITTKWGRTKLVKTFEVHPQSCITYTHTHTHTQTEKKQMPFYCQWDGMWPLLHVLKFAFLFSEGHGLKIWLNSVLLNLHSCNNYWKNWHDCSVGFFFFLVRFGGKKGTTLCSMRCFFSLREQASDAHESRDSFVLDYRGFLSFPSTKAQPDSHRIYRAEVKGRPDINSFCSEESRPLPHSCPTTFLTKVLARLDCGTFCHCTVPFWSRDDLWALGIFSWY